MDKSCNTAVVEGMYVNWTFHRLDAEPASEAEFWESAFVRTSQLCKSSTVARQMSRRWRPIDRSHSRIPCWLPG